MFNIPEVKRADTLLAEALARGRKRASEVRQQRHARAQLVERERLLAFQRQLKKSLMGVAARFPSIDELDEFTTRLLDELVGIDRLKQALGSTRWAVERVSALSAQYGKQLVQAATRQELLAVKRSALGRIASVLRQIDDQLLFLDEARKEMREFPALRSDAFTVAIAGFPNVGKSTLLRRLTRSRPAVAAYPFTTKKLNVGSFSFRHHRIQLIDTPGTLAREKLNAIERKAELALRYAAQLIVYVYDPTEPYALSAQERLARRIEGLGKPVLFFMSKADLVGEEVRSRYEKKGCITDAAVLKEKITQAFATWL